tara:strand:- start:1538 stop:1999 length:462 start_codon:yes stop_codon:yes gene_type:complete
MTRINCIPATMLLDEHLQAAVREGLRPLNEVLSGKDNIKGRPDDWKLGKGHVLFTKVHLPFTIYQWLEAQREYHKRGFKGFGYTPPTFSHLPKEYLNTYRPTKKALRSNLARIIERWRKRKKPYHFKGKVIDNRREFLLYYKQLKEDVLQDYN